MAVITFRFPAYSVVIDSNLALLQQRERLELDSFVDSSLFLCPKLTIQVVSGDNELIKANNPDKVLTCEI